MQETEWPLAFRRACLTHANQLHLREVDFNLLVHTELESENSCQTSNILLPTETLLPKIKCENNIIFPWGGGLNMYIWCFKEQKHWKIFACGADPLGFLRTMKVDTVSLFGCQVMHTCEKQDDDSQSLES